MPRYFVDTFNGLSVIDAEGQDLPNDEAARALARRTLSEMMQEDKGAERAVQFRADVRDASGRKIMAATLLLIVDPLDP